MGPPYEYPPDELIDDFRMACVSRAIDDRQISMQKQSRVFFQISGAGHEALGLALARHLRPGYDWFFPYYRDQALVLGLGVAPKDILLQAVGSAEDPASGGRQMPSHWGQAAINLVTQSSPTGSQCIPAVGCAEAARYKNARVREGYERWYEFSLKFDPAFHSEGPGQPSSRRFRMLEPVNQESSFDYPR